MWIVGLILLSPSRIRRELLFDIGHVFLFRVVTLGWQSWYETVSNKKQMRWQRKTLFFSKLYLGETILYDFIFDELFKKDWLKTFFILLLDWSISFYIGHQFIRINVTLSDFY